MDVGALSLLINEKGFDATMAKVAALDAAAGRVGGKQTEVKVTSPTAAIAQAALERVGQTASAISGAPATVRLTLSGTGEALAALGGVEAEKAKAGGPVVIPVTVPNVGPATTALTALAEAEALQQTRVTALSAALATAGAETTDTATKIATLRAALDQDTQSTASLSEATRSLSIADREGTEVIRLRARALNELTAATNEANRAANIGTTRVVRAPLTGSATTPTAIGPQLGPATPEAEAFAARTRATAAAFEAEALAAQRAAGAIGTETAAKVASGNASATMSPKVRSAANGLTMLAFAATSTNGSFQSMAMGAGLAATSLATMASGPVAAWASGIGAAVVVGAAIIGIFERMTDSAAHAATAVDAVTKSIQGIRSLSEAQAAAAVNARRLAAAEAELAEVQARVRGPASQKPLGMVDFAADAIRLRTLRKIIEDLVEIRKAADHQIAENTVKEATEAQAARLGIITAGTAAENRAYDATSKAFLAQESSKFALGQVALDEFFGKRLSAIAAAGAREVAALRERQQLLAEPVADATPAQSAERAAEIRRIGAEITAVELRTREETTQTTEQRRTEREALDRQIIAFEQKEQEAAGDASRARIAMAKQEAIQIARTLEQRGATPAAANTRAQEFVEAQTQLVKFQALQREVDREFASMAIAREEIQRRVQRGRITEMQGEQEIAAEERKRIPALQQIAAQMLAFAVALKNPDLIAAAKKLSDTLAGMKLPPLTVEEQWIRDIKNEIERQFQLLELLLQPKNIKLAGVADALGNLAQQLGGLAVNAGNSIGSALASGFSSAFTKGSGKSFWEAAGNSIMAGIGSIMVQLGSAMLTYGLIMAVAAPLLAFTPFANQALSAPVAIIAGTALIAAGAGLGAIASNNTGHRTGGGSGARAATSQPRGPETSRVVLDPDRRLREAREIAPRVAVNGSAKAAPTQQPFVFAPTIIGTKDPKAVRDIGEMVNDAWRRNLLKLTPG